MPVPGSVEVQIHDNRLSVLHVGSGAPGPGRLFSLFDKATWRELRLDIDPEVKPDLVASVTDMTAVVPNASVDAIWCSHNLEHLDGHEVMPALREFIRVLKPGGFALIRSPDLEAVAEAILNDGLETVAYNSPAGPITPLDMLYGHGRSIEQGNGFMRHGTGFTQERLGRLLIEAGFPEARTARRSGYELWAVAFLSGASVDRVTADLLRLGADFRVSEDTGY